MNKAQLKRMIYAYDFAIHELVLFLDSHPTNKIAMDLLREYKKRRAEAVESYEEKYGKYFVTADMTPECECWKWLEGPWPWENNFLEG